MTEFIKFHDEEVRAIPYKAKMMDDVELAEGNAHLAYLGIADKFEYVVVGGRNATKIKGPDAAEQLAAHEESERRTAEFLQSEMWHNMEANAAAFEAKMAAGLHTAEELEQIEAPARWLRAKLLEPTWRDMFTAEELEQGNFVSLTRPLHWPHKDDPQYEAWKEKWDKEHEEFDRRQSVWLVERKAKELKV
jgi:hypothetical protein